MTSFEKKGKTYSLMQNSGRKRKRSDRDCSTLTRIIRKDNENITPKITAVLNDDLGNPVSSKAIKRGLHNPGFHGRTAIRKL